MDRSADPQVRRAGKVLNRQDRLASLAVVFEMVLDIAQATTNQSARTKSYLVDALGLYLGRNELHSYQRFECNGAKVIRTNPWLDVWIRFVSNPFYLAD